jgi:excinuclease ABC subunit B
VILYGDQVTDAMRQAMTETERRRKIQLAYNEKNGITPRSVEKAIREGIEEAAQEEAEEVVSAAAGFDSDRFDVEQVVGELEEEMELAARNLQFERAAALRDQITDLRQKGVAGLATLDPIPKRSKRAGRWKR